MAAPPIQLAFFSDATTRIVHHSGGVLGLGFAVPNLGRGFCRLKIHPINYRSDLNGPEVDVAYLGWVQLYRGVRRRKSPLGDYQHFCPLLDTKALI